MIINTDPDAYVPISNVRICPFHLKNAGVPYAGCTCSASYGQRRATESEYRERRRKRLVEKRAWLLEALAEIEAELQDVGK